MADINDWAAFIRGRWNWKAGGYEKGFPRGCGFTDTDATTEFDGHCLEIECKHHDGTGSCEYPETGQLLSLRDKVRRGITVIVLYGCGPCNSPQAIRILGAERSEDYFEDWRQVPDIAERRKLLKDAIDIAQGIKDIF